MKWLDRWLNIDQQPQATVDAADDDERHLAAAALLMEVAHTDGVLDDREQATLVSAIERHWHLNHDAVEDVVARLEARIQKATDLFEFTLPLRESWLPEQRVTLIEEMWQVAAANGVVDNIQESLIRKVSELLYVSHNDYIRAKLKAKELL